MIAGITAHAAVDKACDLLKIKLIKVATDPITCRVNVSAIRKAISPNTIMMYGSAPNYPNGAIDNIEEMSKLAVKYRIGLHVDCCLGGFVLPFAKQLGYKLPRKPRSFIHFDL
jgi:sphinganine-1-phosphate aldolase